VAFVREEEAGSASERAPVIYKHFTFTRRGCASGPCFGFHVARLRSSAYGQTAPDPIRVAFSLGSPKKSPPRAAVAAAQSAVGPAGRRLHGPSPHLSGGGQKARELTRGSGRGGTNRDRSAFRSLIRLWAETSAILLAFRGLVAEPVG
jgi:hypothetical protein